MGKNILALFLLAVISPSIVPVVYSCKMWWEIVTSPWKGCKVLWWVCRSVCLSTRTHTHTHNSFSSLAGQVSLPCSILRSHNLENYTAEFHPIFVHVACGCDSVLLWQCCSTLCTSGFVHDFMFSLSSFAKVVNKN